MKSETAKYLVCAHFNLSLLVKKLVYVSYAYQYYMFPFAVSPVSDIIRIRTGIDLTLL